MPDAIETVRWTPAFEEKHVYYGELDAEQLEHTSLFDYLLQQVGNSHHNVDTLANHGTEYIVYAYERMPFVHPCKFLDDLLYSVAEDDGMSDPDGDGDDGQLSKEAMDELRALEKYVGERIAHHYKPWGCKSVVRIIVPLKEFLQSLSSVELAQFTEEGEGESL